MCPARVHHVAGRERPRPHDRPDDSTTPHRPWRKGRVTAGAAVGAITITAVTAIALAVTGPLASSPGNDGRESTDPVLSVARALPWPQDGQTTVEVEGLGNLGTKGERRPVPIASLTKVMTAYVILRDHPLERGESGPVITIDRAAGMEAVSREESSAPVWEGQRFTERQLLELMLIPSGNNIARLFARWDAGTQEAFVTKMNRAATALGMTHTTYTGASGFEPTTTSTAVDQLTLARQAMRDEVLRAIVAKPSTTVPGVSGTVHNTNTLLGEHGVIGLKTGSSTPAGGALMWAATANTDGPPRLIIGVVLHQHADTTPEEGLRAALDSSRKLIIGVQQSLPSTLTAQHGTR